MDVSQVLADQLKMTGSTLAALREYGVPEGEQRSVDFFYDAPDEVRANALVADLEGTGASAQVESARVGLMRRKTVWSVSGRTGPLVMSEPTLRAWVTSMVQLGGKHESMFDGWGAEA